MTRPAHSWFFRPLCVLVLLVAGALLAPAAEATEGGASHYPFGAQTTYSGFLPPPGVTVFYGYSAFYDADSVRDDDGDSLPGVSLDFAAIAPRFVHTWAEGAGRFKFSSGVLFEEIYIKVRVPGASDKASGIGLFGIEPLYVSASFGNWHFATGSIFYFPTGDYDKTKLANSNLNYAALAYQFNATWTPTPRWDISWNLGAEYNLENKATDYQSGMPLGLTYGVGYRPFPQNLKWDLGFTGYHVRQLTDDRLNGDPVPGGGNRLEKNAIGPKVTYWFTPAVAVVAQWHHEFESRNAPQGDVYWLEWAFPF